jgi:uncharacterized protein (TIGR03086 family)
MDVGDAFARAAAGFEQLVARLDAGDWDRPTVCEVTVRDLVSHVVAGNYFAVRLLGGASAEEAVKDLDDLGTSGDVIPEVAASCAAQTEAFARGDRSRHLHHPSGDIDYETFVRYRLGELVVHGWDVAAAAASKVSFDGDVVNELWQRVAPHLEEMRAAGSYGRGASGSLPTAASVQDRLLDAFGRHG